MGGGGAVACIKERRPLERTRHRCEINIKMKFKEIRCEGVDWIHLAQYRDQWWALVNMVMNFHVHKMQKFLLTV
jgi:hypothetical protein